MYRYQVRGDDGATFPMEQDEPVVVDQILRPHAAMYKVLGVLPAKSHEYDGIVEARWLAGPAVVYTTAA